MGKPRITIQIVPKGQTPDTQLSGTQTSGAQAPGAIEMFLNEEGVDLLVRELKSLSKQNDHCHLFAPEWGDGSGPLNLVAYDGSASTVGHLKILFRPDDWDREHYPHTVSEI